IAVRATFLSALRACAAAPVPRPPQPINPTRSVSLLPRAGTTAGRPSWEPNAPPTTAAVVDDRRKSRREVFAAFGGDIILFSSRSALSETAGRLVHFCNKRPVHFQRPR